MIHQQIIKIIRNNKFQVAGLIWFAFAIIGVLLEIMRGSINNYLIFKNVFWHTIHQTNLYSHYPSEYMDLNHYGPVFSLIISPFALVPDWLGVFIWVILNAYILFYAINRLPVTDTAKNMILLIGSIEMMTSIQNVQFNPMLTGFLILSFICVERNLISAASFLIALCFLVKLYGIAGLAFLPFSRNRFKFLAYFLFWCIILFCLPMIISSPSFIMQTYRDWFVAIVDKNNQNIRITSLGIDISVMGLFRRIFNLQNLPNILFLIPATLAVLVPHSTSILLSNPKLRLNYLAFILISVVIFSSSAESPTYIIAVTGVAIWFSQKINEKRLSDTIALLLVLVITSLSSTDLFPRYIRTNLIVPYSLKALPCFIVWILLLADFLKLKTHPSQKLSAE